MSIEIHRIAPALGAIVEGVQVANATAGDIDEISTLLAEHVLLVFPRQELDAAQHVEFATSFGDPYIHPFLDAVPESPAILQVLKEPDDDATFGGEFWHSDISYENPPAAVSLLHAKEIPTLGGDTLFANQYLAHDTLSEGLRSTLAGLSAHHTYPDMAETDGHASALHPVLRRHPVTRRMALYVNAAFVSRFEGMTRHESAPLLDYLFAHQIRPEFQARISWHAGMLAVWDNRATVHYAVNDHHGARRRLERVTVIERD